MLARGAPSSTEEGRVFSKAVAVLAVISMELDDWRNDCANEETACDCPLEPPVFERPFADEAVEALTKIVTGERPAPQGPLPPWTRGKISVMRARNHHLCRRKLSTSRHTGERDKQSSMILQLAFLAIELLMRLSTPRDKPWRFSPPPEPASQHAEGAANGAGSTAGAGAGPATAAAAGKARPPPRRLLDSIHFDALLEAALRSFEENVNEAPAAPTTTPPAPAAPAATNDGAAAAPAAPCSPPPAAPHSCATLRSAAMNALLVLAEGDEGRARLVALPSAAPHGGVAKIALLLLPQLRAGDSSSATSPASSSPRGSASVSAHFLSSLHRLTWIRAGAPFPERDRALGAILRLEEAPDLLEAVCSHLPNPDLVRGHPHLF